MNNENKLKDVLEKLQVYDTLASRKRKPFDGTGFASHSAKGGFGTFFLMEQKSSNCFWEQGLSAENNRR